MTSREKALLGLMALAGAYGGYVFLVEPLRGKQSQAVRLDKGALEARVGEVRAELAAYHPSEAETGTLPRAQSEWAGDPFFQGKLPSEIAAEKAEGEALAQAKQRDAAASLPANDPERKRMQERLAWEKDVRAKFAYTGFATMGDQRLAVINGVEYRVGEEPSPGGCTIERIEPNQVVLRRTVGAGTVALQIKE
jgi:hypothetical protein